MKNKKLLIMTVIMVGAVNLRAMNENEKEAEQYILMTDIPAEKPMNKNNMNVEMIELDEPEEEDLFILPSTTSTAKAPMMEEEEEDLFILPSTTSTSKAPMIEEEEDIYLIPTAMMEEKDEDTFLTPTESTSKKACGTSCGSRCGQAYVDPYAPCDLKFEKEVEEEECCQG